MSLPDAKSFVRSPSGAVLLGLVSALFLGSLATAGLNTLNVARIMLGASLAILLSYLFFSGATASMTRKERIIAAMLLIGLHVAVERIEATYQPPARQMPFPPLRLMMPPTIPGYLYPETQIPGLPLTAAYISRPTGGYAGFGDVGDNINDDVMLGIGDFSLRNTSSKPIQLSWMLSIRGEGVAFTIDASGKGRWERQLNTNDWNTLHGKGLDWLLSPATIPAHGRLPITTNIGFVAPDADDKIRRLITNHQLDQAYTAVLIIRDVQTGAQASLKLPYGVPPVESGDPIWKELHDQVRRTK